MIQRQIYLDKLINKKENGMVKVITGIRRCGKSYLLFEIYRRYLNSIGVDDSHIISLALDDDENIRYRNPLELGKYIRSLLVDKDKMYYVFLDEIQKVADIPNPYLPDSGETVGFVDVLLGLMKIKNVDLYVTGSNSKMLSSDVSAAYDPMYAEVFEKRSSAFFAKGLVFNKFTGSRGKSGSNDANAEYLAQIRRAMDEQNVAYQFAELGKVDAGGGGTIAYIMANYGMEVIDSGVAVLCMHAPWEITSKADVYEAYKGYKAFIREM